MRNLFTFLFICALSLGLSDKVYSQESTSDTGQGSHGNALNIFASFGDNEAINAHYEFSITNDFTVSPLVNIRFGDNSSFGIGARADYYFDRLLKLAAPWDIYAGTDMHVDFDGGDLNFHGHMGAEYLFNDKWGIIGEFGFGSLSSGSLGVGIHF